VGRTLLSAAFEVEFAFEHVVTKFSVQVKIGGQECPPHTS
jgi:hypothetical protein